MEFVKPGEQNNNEQHEIDTMVSQGQPSATPDAADASVNQPKAEETAPNQPPVSPTQESEGDKPCEDVRHHLTYMANGIWKDSEGQYWHREDGKKGCISHKVITESQLKSRLDLQFMIRYGAIKDVIVK